MAVEGQKELLPLPDTDMRIGGRARWKAIEMFLQFGRDVPPEEISKIIRTGVDQLVVNPRVVGESAGRVDFDVNAIHPDLDLILSRIYGKYQLSRAFREMRIEEIAQGQPQKELAPLPSTDLRVSGHSRWGRVEMLTQFGRNVPPEEISRIISKGVDGLLVNPRIVGEFAGQVDFDVDAVHPNLSSVANGIHSRYNLIRGYRQMRMDEMAQEQQQS